LSGLIHYCSQNRIAPGDVGDANMDAYQEFITGNGKNKDPAFTRQQICRLWNRAVAGVPGWPPHKVTIPSYVKRVSLPWSTFPTSLRDEVEVYTKVMSGQDLFDVRAPEKPLRPRTLESRLSHIWRYASALVHSGTPASELASFAILVEPQ